MFHSRKLWSAKNRYFKLRIFYILNCSDWYSRDTLYRPIWWLPLQVLSITNYFYCDHFYWLIQEKKTIYMFLVKCKLIKLLTMLLWRSHIRRKYLSVSLNFQTTSSNTWHSISCLSLSVIHRKTKNEPHRCEKIIEDKDPLIFFIRPTCTNFLLMTLQCW